MREVDSGLLVEMSSQQVVNVSFKCEIKVVNPLMDKCKLKTT